MVELACGDDGFCGGRKKKAPGEKPLEQGESQQQTQPTNGTQGNHTYATLVGSEHFYQCT